MSKHAVFLIGLLIILIVVSVTQDSAIKSPNSSSPELIELTPLSESRFPNQLQSLVDRLSQAALDNHWATASDLVEQLERTWENMKPTDSTTLGIVQEVDRIIETLHYNVWGRDSTGVLNSSRKLTALFADLS